MQLDKTEIVIRQRSTLELLDLSLVVIRRYWFPLVIASSIVGVPLLLLDVALTSWMVGELGRTAAEDTLSPEIASQQRYTWHMLALWYLQYPLASLPATILLGNQIFFQRLSFRSLLKQLRPVALRALFVLGILRLGLAAIPLELFVDSSVAFDPTLELMVLGGFCVWSTLRRMSNPYAPEILGLEAFRLRSRSKNEGNYMRRSRNLHGMIGGDCFGRFLVCGLVASGIFLMAYSSVFVGDFVGIRRTKLHLLNAMMSSQFLVTVALPAALWCSGVFATVFRFLSYLDARIRLEGWEVELQLRAERLRLEQSQVSLRTGLAGEASIP